MSDIDVMARTIYGEARNQPFEGQVAVAFVILTRSIRRKQSVTEVCLAPLQFSCWNPKDPNRKIIEFVGFDRKEFVRAFGISCLAIRGDLKNPVPSADHYHTIENVLKTKVWPPSWAKKMMVVDEIGDHRFLASKL